MDFGGCDRSIPLDTSGADMLYATIRTFRGFSNTISTLQMGGGVQCLQFCSLLPADNVLSPLVCPAGV